MYVCVCVWGVCVCVCNYSSQTTEPICIKIIPANTASNADCYRLLRLEIFTAAIYKNPQNPFLGAPLMLNQWEIKDSCKAHSKLNRKIFAVYSSNDVVQPKDGRFAVRTMSDIIWGKCTPKKLQKRA